MSASRAGRLGERGSATMETALVYTLLLMIVFAVIQGAMYYHARNAAQSAAAACAEQARGADAGAGAGSSSAYAVLSQSGAMDGASVAVSAGAAEVTCTVTGRAPLIVDLGLTGISQSATLPKDRVTRPGCPTPPC